MAPLPSLRPADRLDDVGRRPFIGLTLGHLSEHPEYLRIRHTYPDAVVAAGGVPLLIPPMRDAEALRQLLSTLDGLVLPGGIDIHPHHFGQEKHPTTRVDDVLDALELDLVRWVIETGTPTLGICRGQQVLNVALGGTLIQDLPSERGLEHTQGGGRADLSHDFEVVPGSRLAGIVGSSRFAVNSSHHQAVDRLGRGLRAVAWAPDGVIEAIESDDHPWLVAVQFHPEDLVEFHEPSRRLLEALVEACRQRRNDARANGG